MKTTLADHQLHFLRQIALFSDLSDDNVRTLALDLRSRQYKKGQTIFHQGDLNCELYIVYKGRIRVYHINPAGEETSVDILGEGGILGEFSALDSLPRSATVEALRPCTLLELSQAKLHAYMLTMPQLAIALSKQVVSKARWTTKYAEITARLDTKSKLLRLLLRYNEQFGRELEPGIRYEVDLGLTQEELASFAGSSRSWVSRISSDWRKRGLIDFRARTGKVTILDLPRIEEFQRQIVN